MPASRTSQAPLASPSPEREQPLVQARGLTKRYEGRTVVDGVDLTVRTGECFGLLGPNGAGKTTTLRMLLGLTPPDAGELTVLGEPIPERAREARTRIGVVPQFDTLDPDFTVRENLVTYASYFGLKGEALARRVEDLLEFASLKGREDVNIQSLSGGMKRRLTLARALINQPELVVLDEPTTGLDPQARHHIWHRLRTLLSRDTTLIITTHYMEEAERLCDRLAIIDRGRVIACDSPRALIQAHIEPHVVELSGNAATLWLDKQGALPEGERLHRVGDIALIYTHDPRPLLERLDADGLRYLHRPANLEDVFLKLTGHDLRD
ncbi:ABC transporter related [Thioalkalivibrio sulfidiphilus HL-EbGr7]|uniref:ABC transporter related n=1 Tax=Thioalkalivibrio sulfidiphilus (strain HL-EbGR7) TaxID=396588 RepID=B8GT03_THISH|nr:ATP-binding cassette domain-containing protein [Thioalkalivibrio sulfidiphilus]ACL73018.1 ABC transporter related [Thioalkalivibrio sulfidiphilus HL-EbGr7]